MTAEAKLAGHRDVLSGGASSSSPSATTAAAAAVASAIMPTLSRSGGAGIGGGTNAPTDHGGHNHDRQHDYHQQQSPPQPPPKKLNAASGTGAAMAMSSSSSSGNTRSDLALLRRYRTEIAASSSSVFSTLAAFPLDSVKTRMQTYHYRGFIDCVRHTYRTEKLGGFFRGVTAPMASVTLVRTVSFSIYQRAKHSYADWIRKNSNFDVLRHVSTPGTYPNMYSIACFGAAGATAGSVITFLACPFELTKLSAQVSVLLADRAGNCQRSRAVAASYQNKGTLRTMGNIIKHRGALGLYTGFYLHLLRDTLGTGIYFMVYESGKQLGTSIFGNDPGSNKLAVVAAGGSCGLVSWALIYPIDSAKSIYQRNSLLHSRGEKVPAPKIEFFKRHMYRGLGVSMSRSCVVNAIFFSSFEFIKRRIKKMDDEAKGKV